MRLRPLPLTLINRVPAELMEQILDNTRGDTQTLLACLQVCSAWHNFLIDFLYEPIRLHKKPQVYRLARTARIFPAIRDHLASTRTIVLSQRDDFRSKFAHVFPLVLGLHLHKVEHLSFFNCSLQQLHPSFFAMLYRLRNVKHLSLADSYFAHFADLRRMVCAFPLLEEVDFARNWVYICPQQHHALASSHILGLPCAPRLTTIHIRWIDDNIHSVEGLFSSGVCSSIQTLRISPCIWNNLEANGVYVLLSYTAPTLEHLRMRIMNYGTHFLLSMRNHVTPYLADPSCRYGFAQLTHLRVLDVTLAYSKMHVSSEDLRQELRSILVSLTSPALESIRLVFEVGSIVASSGQDASFDNTTNCAQYADLHDVLARPAFSCLRRIQVVLCACQWKHRMRVKDLALNSLIFPHALLAPWCMRGVVNLACIIRAPGEPVIIVLDKWEGPRCLESPVEKQRCLKDLRLAALAALHKMRRAIARR